MKYRRVIQNAQATLKYDLMLIKSRIKSLISGVFEWSSGDKN